MSNLNVIIPTTFYKTEAQQQYEDIPGAMVREIIQNAQDAGASRVDFTAQDNTLTACDNGSGLTVDQFQERMLTLGGTVKESGSVGGFGAAKKLLLFAHESWKVTGQHFAATGTYHESITQVNGHRARGLCVEMTSDLISPSAIEEALDNLLSRSRIKVAVTFNGTVKTQGRALRSNQLAYDFEFGTLFVVKSDPRDDYNERGGSLVIRTNGIFTARDIVGTPYHWYLELDGRVPSTQVLNESRDGLRYEIRRRVYDYISSVMATGKTEKQPTSTVSVFGLDIESEIVHHTEAGEISVTGTGFDDTEDIPTDYEDTRKRADVKHYDMQGNPTATPGAKYRIGGSGESSPGWVPVDWREVPLNVRQQAEEMLERGEYVDVFEPVYTDTDTGTGHAYTDTGHAYTDTDTGTGHAYEDRAQEKPKPKRVKPWHSPFAVMADKKANVYDAQGALKPKFARAMEVISQSLNLVADALGTARPIPALLISDEAQGRHLATGNHSIIGINVDSVDCDPFELLDVILHELAHEDNSGHDYWFIEAKEALARRLSGKAMSTLTMLVRVQAQKRKPAQYWVDAD